MGVSGAKDRYQNETVCYDTPDGSSVEMSAGKGRVLQKVDGEERPSFGHVVCIDDGQQPRLQFPEFGRGLQLPSDPEEQQRVRAALVKLCVVTGVRHEGLDGVQPRQPSEADGQGDDDEESEGFGVA
eukprot:TRINITY_DN4693_c0_g1_i1.p1 TRINITY_DN4693_c0_g1~~TRINITY_DN4693_c0_g1_i1.p1  ORF type:complete len:127 (+),score=37.11 TRINITY_DN4693_c0_g1_i1:70-450(+)